MGTEKDYWQELSDEVDWEQELNTLEREVRYHKTQRGKVHTVGADPYISLKDLKSQVEEWSEEYGEDAVLWTDAGYNNVNLRLDTRKGTIKGYKKEI